MKKFIKLNVIETLAFLCCLSGTGIMLPAAAASAEAVAEAKSPRVERSVVMNWPEHIKTATWARLSTEQRNKAQAIVKGETSPLKHFPPGLVELIVRYMDIRSLVYSMEVCLDKALLGNQASHISKPIRGLSVESNPEGGIDLLIFTCADTVCARIIIQSKGKIGLHDTLATPAGRTRFLTLYNVAFTTQKFKYSKFVTVNTGEVLDCCIADYDEKDQGGTKIEWNTYDREEARTICALHGACKGYAVKQDEKTS